jgi:hypothetical protein
MLSGIANRTQHLLGHQVPQPMRHDDAERHQHEDSRQQQECRGRHRLLNQVANTSETGPAKARNEHDSHARDHSPVDHLLDGQHREQLRRWHPSLPECEEARSIPTETRRSDGRRRVAARVRHDRPGQ